MLFVFVDIMKHTFMRLPTFLFFAKPMNNSGLMISRTISAENIRVYEKKSHFSVDNLRNEVYTLDVPCKVI